MNDFTDAEKRLYEESRRLKFQAREMRKARLAREELNRKAREMKAEADRKAEAARAKENRDTRIRAALQAMADIAKRNSLAFDAPFGYGTSPAAHAFYLIDKVSGDRIDIKSHPTGFSWD